MQCRPINLQKECYTTKKSELLSRGSLLFHSDPFISFFAVQAWISASLIQHLPPSFKNHNVTEIIHLLQTHNFGESSQNLLVASRIDNLFTHSIKADNQVTNIEEILNFIANDYEWIDIVIWVNEKLCLTNNKIYFRSEHNHWIEKRFEYALIDLSRPCTIVGNYGAINEFILSVDKWSTIPSSRTAN